MDNSLCCRRRNECRNRYHDGQNVKCLPTGIEKPRNVNGIVKRIANKFVSWKGRYGNGLYQIERVFGTLFQCDVWEIRPGRNEVFFFWVSRTWGGC